MKSKIRNKLAQKFQDKTYFDKFFRQRVQDEIALGIQNLREMRTLNQAELAELCTMKQSAISRIENADYASWNFKTLSRVAEALDARLKVLLETREEVIKEYQGHEIVGEESSEPMIINSSAIGDLSEDSKFIHRVSVASESKVFINRSGGKAVETRTKVSNLAA
ncbi:MAG: helix-turn-helix transcriptional regulator [Nitrospinae bacterium]|nr:helix-turn-helix transcriptional regulator [Nitrospinota bacterium]